MAELLRIDNLSAGYGEAVILHGIGLSLAQGETLALLGRNGTGKTTLMNTIAGATRQHAGRIRLDGLDLQGLPSHQRAAAGVGWVPQERDIFKSLTVLENLTAVARPGAWTPERVFGLFPRLAERKSNMGNQLSGGEQQMLAVGRALVLNPKLLLLDEPLEGITRDEGLSAIIVEQHPQAILAISHQAVVLDQGRVIHSGKASDLQAQPELLDALLGIVGTKD
ncbi:MAG: ABC transporter ATP-binding protein [Betaproteobacteria bacterium]|nr:ABC transporter ATP-binding protein [Betaproteobacteria bacterium]